MSGNPRLLRELCSLSLIVIEQSGEQLVPVYGPDFTRNYERSWLVRLIQRQVAE